MPRYLDQDKVHYVPNASYRYINRIPYQPIYVTKLQLKLHPSIREPSFPDILSGDFNQNTIIHCINQLVSDYPNIKDLILEDGRPKAGLLFIANKTELDSLGLLDEELDEDLLIRVVPILHGG